MVVCAVKFLKVCKYITRTRGRSPESKNTESCGDMPRLFSWFLQITGIIWKLAPFLFIEIEIS